MLLPWTDRQPSGSGGNRISLLVTYPVFASTHNGSIVSEMEEVQKKNLDYVDDLLEEFKNTKRKFAEQERRYISSAETFQLPDILEWLASDQEPLPSWKEHLIKMYVKRTVELYFTGGHLTKKPLSKKNKVESPKSNMNRVNKSKDNCEIPQKRIIKGTVRRIEPPEKKKVVPVIGNDKKELIKCRPPIPSNKKHINSNNLNNTKKKEKPKLDKNSTIKSELLSKEDLLWKDIFSRNNFNPIQVREEPVDSNSSCRPISPLVVPNISITPRKRLQLEQVNTCSGTYNQISPFNIDKFLSKIKETDCTNLEYASSPAPSECSSFTFPILSGTPSLSCYVESFSDDRYYANFQLDECHSSCSECYQKSPSNDGDSPFNQWNSAVSTPRSTRQTEKELQRMQLESNPRFKRVIDKIRRASGTTEDVQEAQKFQCNSSETPELKSSTSRQLNFNQEKIFSYRPTCCSSSLSTGLSEMRLETDFTDANSDVLISPSSSSKSPAIY